MTHNKIQYISVLLSALCTLPLLLQMIFDWAGMPNIIPLWIQFLLATIVQFGFGWGFYVGSYDALKTFTGNMDLLVCLGTSAAYFYSAFLFFAELGANSVDRHLYFESSSTIITLILLGRLLEARTMGKASHAIQSLLQLQPKTARIQKGEQWSDVPIESIQLGDIFQVRPGEKIPIDGYVLEGDSYVDESMLTGESLATHKFKDSKVFAGTQNEKGFLLAQATAVGAQTALAAIIQIVQEAQSSKASMQNLADKVSAVFVPIVVVISIATFFLWWGIGHDITNALINGVAVLVIACPCALGMATPMVVMVSSGIGAREGILIKNADALEAAEHLDIVALDKTGTLTEGKPSLIDVIPDMHEIRSLASSLEALSEHPIASAIAAASPDKEKVTAFEAWPGKGVCGNIHSEKYWIGSVKWAQERGLQTDDEVVVPLELAGKSVTALTHAKKILGYLAVSDKLRESAKEGIDKLKALGLDVVMLTGDHQKTAQTIATQAGISHFYAEASPQDKAQIIERLKKDGKKIAMVGDGINDAPALAAADVGFSMSTGTDIAREASDITLMRSDIGSCAVAIELSRATFRKMRQNLFFAFIYNVLGIPLAAAGLLNPIIAGAAMALSSLCVVINSLLLNKWRPTI